jgi:hypothetical protein
MTDSLNLIRSLIATTNNGKLMVANIPFPARREVPDLIASGALVRATFMRFADAVRLP